MTRGERGCFGCLAVERTVAVIAQAENRGILWSKQTGNGFTVHVFITRTRRLFRPEWWWACPH